VSEVLHQPWSHGSTPSAHALSGTLEAKLAHVADPKAHFQPMNLSWSQLRGFMASSPALKAREVGGVAGVPGGELGAKSSDSSLIARIQTDSRSLMPGDLFLALKGEQFDGHDYLAQVKDKGALGAVAQSGLLDAGLPGFEVEDSTLALGEIAHAWRAQFDLGLIAVTGSNGKTTVTQMMASILRAWMGEAALATQGNFNNAIGVPLTLLRLRPHHRSGVLELGMNHIGEIANLARWVSPQVALVNNAQREHQEFMGSVEAVAIENGHVLEALRKGGVAVFPMDDAYAPLWTTMAGQASCCMFGRKPGAQVQLLHHGWLGEHYSLRVLTPQGEVSLTLHMAGEHNVDNALASVACCVSLGVPLSAVSEGIASFRAVSGRGQLHQVMTSTGSITLVDDTYNANPDSVLAAIDVLKNLPKPHVLVLGDMGEVGESGEQYHLEVGEYASACGIDVLFTMGDLSQCSARAFAPQSQTQEATCPNAFEPTAAGLTQLLASLDVELQRSCSVLVKGSRFMRMERVVQHVLSQSATQKGLSCS